MSKILFIATRSPYDICDGRSYTLNSYINTLSEEYEVKVLYFDDNPMTLENDYLKKPSFLEKMFNSLFLSLFGGKPFQVSAMYCRKSKKKVKRILSSYQPDYVICDMCRTAPYIQKFQGKRILDMDDILSGRYLQAYKSKNKNAFGQLESSMPSFFTKIVHGLHIDTFINKFEYKHMLKYELKLTKEFEATVLVSPKETNTLSERAEVSKVYCWPVVVSSEEKIVEDYNPKILSFVGNMNVSHNQTTLNEIIQNILTKLDDTFTLRVVGKCSDEVKEKFQNPRVTFTGMVESIKDNIVDTLLMVAPIQVGSGIKIKILESMAFGLPILTTTIGVEGLSIENGKNIIVADDYETMIQAIQKLSSDSVERNTISNEAIQYTKTYHNYDSLREAEKNTLKNL